MTLGLEVDLGNINELARVSGHKNLKIATGPPNEKNKVWETIPMFTKWISKTLRKHQESKHRAYKSSYMVIEKVPQQTSKST